MPVEVEGTLDLSGILADGRIQEDGDITISINPFYYDLQGTKGYYQGAIGETVADNNVSYVYLDGYENMQITTAGYSSEAHIRLGRVVASGGFITRIISERALFTASAFVSSANEITTDTSNFNVFLSSLDTDVQKALDTLDGHIQTSTTGGTSITTYTTGDIIYSDGYNSLTKLPIGSDGYILKVNGTVPSWESEASSFPASSITTNTSSFNTFLSSADDTVQKALDTLDDHVQTEVTGGTGIITYTAGDIIYADSANSLAKLALGSDGYVLKINGTSINWEQQSSSDITTNTSSFNTFLSTSDNTVQKALDTLDDHIQTEVTGGTGITTYTAGDIIYADSVNSLAKLSIGTDGYLLKINSGIPSWESEVSSLPASNITADTSSFNTFLSASDDTVQKALDTLDDHIQTEVTGGTGITTYTTGDIIYADGSNSLNKLPISSDGYKLIINSGLPIWAQDLPIVDYQYQESLGRSTTTSTSFQTKLTLTTGVLTGNYVIQWGAIVDQVSDKNFVESRLQNTTDAVTVGASHVHEPKDFNNRIYAGGFSEITFSGSSKTFEIQYRVVGNNTAGIQAATIMIWKVQ